MIQRAFQEVYQELLKEFVVKEMFQDFQERVSQSVFQDGSLG